MVAADDRSTRDDKCVALPSIRRATSSPSYRPAWTENHFTAVRKMEMMVSLQTKNKQTNDNAIKFYSNANENVLGYRRYHGKFYHRRCHDNDCGDNNLIALSYRLR